MARHSQHDIIDAVHRLSTAVADATDDMNALETGAATIETLERDRPVVRRTVVEPEAQVGEDGAYLSIPDRLVELRETVTARMQS